ncbi:DUF1801 domain-containing protein [Sulfurimonas sp. HSL-3221]|uniref:DUF1801 domain-containing protein n=1 Tax=Sulfurimonas diazotrophicus TaxID=3131939 RepID=A0ABZ3HCF2_9BACT|nr:DUF1801 domain-containing protein [Sulfurimonas sp. HSL-3221]UFS63486.1 DUF1801 domain-containing protein [Sulfurimonas sp. HSL-3221]
MARKANSRSPEIVPGGVDAYIEKYPQEVRDRLHEIRGIIEAAAPDATETVSYFEMPGYLYEGYDYHGMFAWFSYKRPHVRLHVRPPVLEEHQEELENYATTKSIISFPVDKAIPKALVEKLVKASIRVMKQKPNAPKKPK